MQESNEAIPSTTTEIEKYFSASTQTLTNSLNLEIQDLLQMHLGAAPLLLSEQNFLMS